jgi:UMF1 family MFS transporter
MQEVILFFAIVQASAISGSYLFGFLTDKLGPKKTINLTLYLWMAVVVGGFLSFTAATFYIVGLIAGVAMGSSQAASRALMGRLIPENMEAEFFGFYALTGKFSAVLGPLLFGLTSLVTGSQRIAVLSVLVFFITGYILLQRVDEQVTYKKVTI